MTDELDTVTPTDADDDVPADEEIQEGADAGEPTGVDPDDDEPDIGGEG